MHKRVLSIIMVLLLIIPVGSVFADEDTMPSSTPAAESPTPEPTSTPTVSPTPTPEASPTPTPTPTPEASPTPTPEVTPTPSPDASAAISVEGINQHAVHSVALVADATSPQAAFTSIQMTAVIADSSNYDYRFECQRDDGDWTVLRDWDDGNTYTWTPLVYGSYTLRVSVRPKGGSIASRSDLFYTITSRPWKGFSDAAAISAGSPVDAGLSTVGEHDMYRFTAPMDGTYTIRTTGGTDTFGALFDSTGTLITENDNDTDTNFSIASEMTAGSVYYFGVRHAGAGMGAYTLSVDRVAIPVQSVTLQSTPGSSCEYNLPVKLTAEITAGDTMDALYRFQVRKSGSSWQAVRDFAPENEYTWTPSSIGTYDIRVLARNGVQVEDATATITAFSAVDIPKQQGVTLTTDLTPNQEYNTPITLFAAPEGDPALTTRAEYRYMYQYGTTWYEIQDWTDSDNCTWTPSKKGSYQLRVYTRTKGRTNDYDKYATISSSFTDIPKQTSVALTPDKLPIQEAGTPITLSAQASIADPALAARAEYQFKYKFGTVTEVIRDWDSESTCTWTPNAKGTYTLYVYARTGGRSSYDVYETYTYTVDIEPLTDVNLTANQSSPQKAGMEIILEATAQGRHAAYAEYLFRVKDGDTWRTLKTWGPENTCAWTPPKEYVCTVEVQARSAGRSGTDQTATIENYFIYSGKLPVDGLNVEISPGAPQECYAPIRIVAQATGNSADNTEEYQLRVKLGSDWYTLSPWSIAKDFTWAPSKSGTYTIEVQARAANRSGYDAIYTETYVVNDIPRQPGVKLTTDIEPIQEPNTTINLSALTTATDQTLIDRAEYKFQVNLNGTWTTLNHVDGEGQSHEWSDVATRTWTPAAAGQYTLRVYTRTKAVGERDGYDQYTDKSFKIETIPLTGVSLSGNPPSPVKQETRVTFTAEAEGVNADNAEYRFTFYNGRRWYTVMRKDENGNTVEWSEENSFIDGLSNQFTYVIKVQARAKGRTSTDVSCTLNFRVGESGGYTYSADTMATLQDMYGGAVKSSGGRWVDASKSDILHYVDPNNWLDGQYKYQFLSLNYISGIKASDLNAIISGNSQNGGVLNNKGAAFLAAAQEYNINPAYLVSHAMLETGNGSSPLATGIVVNGKKVYNVFGIHAYDSNPNYYGSQYAYEKGWFSVDAAITGGAEWISKYYINRESGEQNTLYAMRWNPNAIQKQIDSGDTTPRPTHQYATDIAWAVKQVDRLKSLMDRCVGAVLEFFIPKYR